MATYREIFKMARLPMVLLDRVGRYMDHNHAYRALMGYSANTDLIDFSPKDVSPEFQPDKTRSSEQVKVYVDKAFKEGSCEFPWLHKRLDGTLFPTHVYLQVTHFKGQPCLLASVSDFTEESRIQDFLNEAIEGIVDENRFLSSLVSNTLVGLLVTNENRDITMVNQRLLDILKYEDESDLLGQPTSIFYQTEDDYIRFGMMYKQAYESGEPFKMAYQFMDSEGNHLWCDVSGSPLDDHEPPDLSKGVLWVVEDITEKKRITKELEDQYLLAKDANPLTGLPGNNTIKRQLKQSVGYQANHSVLYVDIDNFKSYNDKYGFVKGDDVLIGTARILTQVGRDLNIDSYFVGNIGGDDFVLIVEDARMFEVAEKVIELFTNSVEAYYSSADVAKGEITSRDRDGKIKQFPLMGISIAGVALKDVRGLNYIEVIDVCAELKHEAKLHVGSYFAYNRRCIE